MDTSRLLTKDIFEKLDKHDKYYTNERWLHFSEVISLIKQFDKIDNVLEIGPYKSPFFKNSDIMDIVRYEYPFDINLFIKHDCSKVPFPVDDKKYDLVIASQVLEHLGIRGQQVKVFDEIERISHKAIITLPYKWHVPNFRHHHMIDEKVFDVWASNREYSTQKIGGNGDFRRILRVYEFLF